MLELRAPRTHMIHANVQTNCPACGSANVQTFFELSAMPVLIGVQWPDAASAKHAARGDFRLEFCEGCGFIWNSRFDPARLEYSRRYDNALEFSPVFRQYAEELSRRLIDTYEIRNQRVVEIGCGKGYFLTLLCEQGNNRGVGFDPSYDTTRDKSAATDRIEYHQELFSENHAAHVGDLLCCRHVFEHIAQPLPFLQMIRRSLAGRRQTIVYFEVPDVRHILDHLSVWDIIYEHCSYFSRESLRTLFRRAGFEVLRLQQVYRSQFLSLDARGAAPDQSGRAEIPEDVSGLRLAVARFAGQVHEQTAHWRARLQHWQAADRCTVLWGAGAKAVTFLNILGLEDAIPCVVDINPHKQGLFLPGTGQPIVPPTFLRQLRPQVVVLMNPIYRAEVEASLRTLGVDAEVEPAS